MAKKIFKAIITLVSLAMVMLFAIFMFVAYNFVLKMEYEHLEIEMNRFEQPTHSDAQAYTRELAKRGIRMTMIQSNGKVIYDNEVDPTVTDNHLNREEIKEAQLKNIGHSLRFSDSLKDYNLYLAKKLDNGDIVRLSMHRNTLFYILMEMSIPILLMSGLLLIIAYKVAKRVSKKIVEPINKINLASPLEDDIDEELWPLIRRIDHQNELIEIKTILLKKGKEEFIAIIENLSEALVLLDFRYEIINANRAARTLFTIANGESFIRYNRDEKLRETIDNIKKFGYYESPDIKIGERKFFLKGNVINNSIIALLAIDITERVEAEEQRRKFTANVSHELRTPLQSIMGSAELIEAGLVEPKDVKKFASTIHKESKRLLGLINDLLYLSKLDEKKVFKEKKKIIFNLKDLVENVVESLKIIADKKNIKITTNLQDLEIKNYEKLVFEIIYNIVENSIKYGRQNGNVKITINNDYEIEIADDGIGISESEKNRIFERFYRVEKARSQEKTQGTGLGLAIVKHGIEICGARLQLDSKLGVGTKITIKFPKDIAK